MIVGSLRLQDLHALMTGPLVGASPDLVMITTDKGSAEYHSDQLGGSRSFAAHYTAVVIIREYGGSPLIPIVAVCDWLTDINANHTSAPVSWDVDWLQEGLFAVEIRVPLSERVRVYTDDSGQLHVEPQPEPDLEALTGFDRFPVPDIEEWPADG